MSTKSNNAIEDTQQNTENIQQDTNTNQHEPTGFDTEGEGIVVSESTEVIDPEFIEKGGFKRYKSVEDELQDFSISYDRMRAREAPTSKPKPQQTQQEIVEEDTTPDTTEVPATTPIQEGDEPRASRHTKIITKADGSQVVARDYSGIDEADIPFFKKMGIEAFEWSKDRYIERKKVAESTANLQKEIETLQKTGVPRSYYQHPQAFVLSPKYNEMDQRLKNAHAIMNHWNEQAIRIRRGETFVDLNTDEKGNLVKSEPRQPTVEDEVNVSNYLAGSQHQYMLAQMNLRQFVDSWQGVYNEDVNYIKSIEKDFFPNFDDEKHPTRKIQQTIIEGLPKSQQDNLLAPLLAKAGASNVMLQNDNKRLRQENNMLKAKLGLKGKQQPVSRMTPSGKIASAVSYSALRNRY